MTDPARDADLDEAIETVRGWVRDARRVVVLTGAGISTESGIQDFRGPDGLWTKNPGAEKMATLQHYMSDPAVRVRTWRNRLESKMWSREPNDGHRAITALEAGGRLHALITQNVDGLHQKAGTSPDRVIEIHGTVHEFTCMGDDCDDRGPMAPVLARIEAGEEDPPCRSCGGILKSATISFGQGLIPEDMDRLERVSAECDLMLAVGSTLGVFPAANAVPIAKQTGARVVILNGEPTEMDSIADVVLRGRIGEVLPRLVDVGPAD